MSDTNKPRASLPSDGVALLRPLLEEFRSAKRGDWKHIIRQGATAVMASRDVSHLPPLIQGKIIVQVKEVRIKLISQTIYIIKLIYFTLKAGEELAP